MKQERNDKLDKWLASFPFEDGIDGTPFDNAVINAVESLKRQWTEEFVKEEKQCPFMKSCSRYLQHSVIQH